MTRLDRAIHDVPAATLGTAATPRHRQNNVIITSFFRQDAAMPTTLSIKNAPDDIVARLKRRAAKNHRSLQGELMAIIEAATENDPLTPSQFLAAVRRDGLRSASDSAEIIRTDRDRDDLR